MDVVVIRRQGHAIGRVGRRVAPIHDRGMAVIADTAAATIGTAGIVAAGGDARFAEVGLAALVELDADLGESQRWRDAVVARIAELRSRRAAAQRRVAFGIDGDEGKTVVADAGAGLPEPESEISPEPLALAVRLGRPGAAEQRAGRRAVTGGDAGPAERQNACRRFVFDQLPETKTRQRRRLYRTEACAVGYAANDVLLARLAGGERREDGVAGKRRAA